MPIASRCCCRYDWEIGNATIGDQTPYVVFFGGALVPVQGLKDTWTGYYSGSDTNVAAFRIAVDAKGVARAESETWSRG